MVVVSSKESYCHGIMQAMNRLRLEGKLCDVSLVVKDKTINAHRCILVAGSDYFKSRFIGPFKADTMQQVDLSAITSDVAAVELMLNFLYTGENTIDSTNVEPILKVSSFFMISELRDLCADFMEKNLALNTCLKYFLLSVDHMIPEIGKKLEQTIKSRFHDYLIFDNQSLKITPDQLLYLIQNCQIFENCSNADILVYVHQWVESGDSHKHELLGCDILEFVCSRGRKVQVVDEDTDTKSSESLERLKTAIDRDVHKSAFHDKLKRIIAKSSTKSRSETKVLRPLTSRSSKLLIASKVQSETEDVLITISPKQILRELVEKEEFPMIFTNIQDDEPVFDLCVYAPRTRSWHYLQEALLEDAFVELCVEDADLSYCISQDKLCCMFPNEEVINMLHLNESSWTTVDYKHREQNNTALEMSNDYCLCTENGILYLLLRVIVYANQELEEVVQIYFKCFKSTPEYSWLFMFSTPRISTDNELGSFAATVSSKGNEIIIMYQTVLASDDVHVFIAEIDAEATTNPTVHHFTESHDCFRLFDELHILESRGHFYLLTLLYTQTGFAKVSCCFKYKCRSRQLNNVLDTCLIDDDKAFQYSESKCFPCNYKYNVRYKNSLWLFGGTKDHGSSLIEVSIDNKGKLVYQRHKPPPFSRVIAMVPGRIDIAYLSPLKTITKYLSG